MELRHRCKLCHRSFLNGRALGGHMKAHLAILPLPPKPEQLEEEEEEEEKAMVSYGLRENPKKSFRFSDPELGSYGSVVEVEDRESDTIISRRRSRLGSRRPKPSSPTVSSSVSDTSPEEDVAICLMMLSRDVWNNSNNVRDSEEFDFEKKPINMIKKKISASAKKKKKKKKKNGCEHCNKVFRSYQAMCSHMNICSYNYENMRRKHTLLEAKTFECPYCGKVFGSGQALGGHKRSHQLNINNITPTSTTLSNSVEHLIDLNLPAPNFDDQDDLSVLSDA